MSHNEMLHDIEKWSDERLRQWLVDSVDRYETVGASEKQAIGHTTLSLILMLGKILAGMDVTPHQAGDKLAETINEIRRLRAREKSNLQ